MPDNTQPCQCPECHRVALARRALPGKVKLIGAKILLDMAVNGWEVDEPVEVFYKFNDGSGVTIRVERIDQNSNPTETLARLVASLTGQEAPIPLGGHNGKSTF